MLFDEEVYCELPREAVRMKSGVSEEVAIAVTQPE
jgi:hypothetical protein